MITGTPSVGKTKTCEAVFQSFPNSAFFDGDWGWCVNPFSLDDPRLRNGDRNISFVLNTYLQSQFDYVFCPSVLFMFPEIRKSILKEITATGYDLLVFHLKCSRESLAKRHYGQGLTYEPAYQWLDKGLCVDDIAVDTDDKAIDVVGLEIAEMIERPSVLPK